MGLNVGRSKFPFHNRFFNPSLYWKHLKKKLGKFQTDNFQFESFEIRSRLVNQFGLEMAVILTKVKKYSANNTVI